MAPGGSDARVATSDYLPPLCESCARRDDPRALSLHPPASPDALRGRQPVYPRHALLGHGAAMAVGRPAAPAAGKEPLQAAAPGPTVTLPMRPGAAMLNRWGKAHGCYTNIGTRKSEVRKRKGATFVTLSTLRESRVHARSPSLVPLQHFLNLPELFKTHSPGTEFTLCVAELHVRGRGRILSAPLRRLIRT